MLDEQHVYTLVKQVPHDVLYGLSFFGFLVVVIELLVEPCALRLR